MHSVIDWKCRPEVRKYQKLVHGDGAGKSVLLGLDTIPLHQHVCWDTASSSPPDLVSLKRSDHGSSKSTHLSRYHSSLHIQSPVPTHTKIQHPLTFNHTMKPQSTHVCTNVHLLEVQARGDNTFASSWITSQTARKQVKTLSKFTLMILAEHAILVTAAPCPPGRHRAGYEIQLCQLPLCHCTPGRLWSHFLPKAKCNSVSTSDSQPHGWTCQWRLVLAVRSGFKMWVLRIGVISQTSPKRHQRAKTTCSLSSYS